MWLAVGAAASQTLEWMRKGRPEAPAALCVLGQPRFFDVALPTLRAHVPDAAGSDWFFYIAAGSGDAPETFVTLEAEEPLDWNASRGDFPLELDEWIPQFFREYRYGSTPGR